jgi:hypothetical protein
MSCPSPSTKLAIGSPCLTSCQYEFPDGTFCENNVVKACPAGSYCEISPFRPFQPMKRTCPEGKYCPVGTRIPVSCLENGTYCPLGSAAPKDCEPGYFCNNLHEYRNQCPQGRYCPGKTGPESLPCPAGYDCAKSPTGNPAIDPAICPAGYYCPQGTGEYNTTTNSFVDPKECPRGKFCPAGSSTFTVCPAGTFAGNGGKRGGGAAACTDCPPGTFCPPPVGEGYYKLNHPTYGLITNIPTCPQGKYCPNARTITPEECSVTQLPTGKTQKNWCPEGSASKTPCANCPNKSFPNSCASKGVGECKNADPTASCCDVIGKGTKYPDCPSGWVKSSDCYDWTTYRYTRCTRASCK